MKILVPVKRVVDYNVKIRVDKETNAVDLNNVKMSINPFDEIAVEEAIRIKEVQLDQGKGNILKGTDIQNGWSRIFSSGKFFEHT